MVDVERPSHHVRRLLIACLLLVGCGSPQDPDRQTPTPQKLWPTPVRYEVDARWEQNRLEGRMLLALRNGGPDTLDHVWMRTWPNALASCRRPLATLTPSVEAKE